jgi:hypothetical protein
MMLQKRVHSTHSASDKAYQLFAYGRWFSPGTAATSTTKTGRHDIAEILLIVAPTTSLIEPPGPSKRSAKWLWVFHLILITIDYLYTPLHFL